LWCSLRELELNLENDFANQEQVGLFIDLTGVGKGDVVSVAVDAMAMIPDRSCLAAKSNDYFFVSSAQPL
jgi:hypothetical protein